MFKRSIGFALISCLVLASLLVVAWPKPVEAGIVNSPPPTWSGATYQGPDSFYSVNVIAFEEGSDATLVAQVHNDATVDVTVKSANLVFDWGNEYAATSFPSELSVGEVGLVTFDFVVPSTTVATNSALHTYTIEVIFEMQTQPMIVSRNVAEMVGFGNNVTKVFNTDNAPVTCESESVYFVDNTTGVVTPQRRDTDYTIDYFTGAITFATAPPSGQVIVADYDYPGPLAVGDGHQTIFQAPFPPYMRIASGSETLCLHDMLTNSYTKLERDVDYTLDYRSGKFTLTTAPQAWQMIWASFSLDLVWLYPAGGFAVYSADQAEAQGLNQQFNTMWPSWYTPTAADSIGYALSAQEQWNLGDQAYRRGDFTAAKAYLQNAVDNVQAAIDADLDWATAYQDALAAQQAAETAQTEADTARIIAETALVAKESARLDAEAAQMAAEAALAAKEQERIDAEIAQMAAESALAAKEQERIDAEIAQMAAEAALAAKEQEGIDAEIARMAAEAELTTNEVARLQAEAALLEAQAAQVEAETGESDIYPVYWVLGASAMLLALGGFIWLVVRAIRRPVV